MSGTTNGADGVLPIAALSCPPDTELASGEHFGPALAVLRSDSVERTLSLARSASRSLATAVFTRDPARADHVAEAVGSGFVTINDCLVPTGHPGASVLGRGQSGWGVTRGELGLLAMTTPQFVSRTSRLVRGADGASERARRAEHDQVRPLVLRALIGSGTMNDSGRRVVVVGGGLAGLAAAVEMRTRGAEVTLVESNAHVGGKMNVLEESGYRFDMGPTILTLPEVLCGIIRRSGRSVRDVIELVRLDPQWRCHFEDGVVVDLRGDTVAMSRHLDELFPGSGAGEGYRRFLDYSRRMNRLSRSVFFYKDVGGIRDVMRSAGAFDKSVMSDAMAMRLHSTVGATIKKHVREPHTQQILEHFLQYVGSSPFLAPAILTMIASAQADQGCWYAMGGTRMVARALERLAREGGVEIRTGTLVERIVVEDGRAVGVVTGDGETIDADAVVSNCDVQRTLTQLVGGSAGRGARSRVAGGYTPACSGVVLYLGLDRQYEHLAHHNFLFSHESEDEFGDIYGRGIPARDPTLYIAAPSRTDPEQAPAGGEALYILVHTPYLREGHDWDSAGGMLEGYRSVIIEKLARFGMEDVEDRIVVERSLTPNGIERMYNAEGGAIYGLASHGRLRGGFKPRNSSPIPGLYFSGGSANPGPGVPMVLMSGVTAADAAARDLGLDGADLEGTSYGPNSEEVGAAPEFAPA